MVQPANRRLATEQYVTDGLSTKVNSSTYTAGLGGKVDYPAGGTDGQALIKSGTSIVWGTVAASGGGGGTTSVVDNGDGTASTTSSSVADNGDGTATAA